jgi:outer membrane protein assembly factor BamD (BamD/ComL family)
LFCGSSEREIVIIPNLTSIILSKSRCNPLSVVIFIQEFHVSQTYHEGLLKLQAKEYEKARELLESVLRDPLIASAQVFTFQFLCKLIF